MKKPLLQAYSDGMILTEIQKEFGVSIKTIHRWRGRFTNIPLRAVYQKEFLIETSLMI